MSDACIVVTSGTQDVPEPMRCIGIPSGSEPIDDIPDMEAVSVSLGADIPFIPGIGDDLVEVSRADLRRAESVCGG